MVLDGLLGFCITEGILIPGSGASDVQSTTTVSLSACLGDLNNVTMDGPQLNPVTVKAIIAMPTPTESQEVCQFLGAINWLEKFCSQLSSVA